MTILMTSDLAGVDAAGYQHLVDQLGDVLTSTDGFLAHAAGPTDTGWRVVELWTSEEAHRAWFDAHVVPTMPPGAPLPTITIQPVTNTLVPLT
jgi:hypothetical protein